MKKRILILSSLFVLFSAGSCDEYLDIVPDNVPVIDLAFNTRTMAERYLATCYNKLPVSTNLGSNVGFFGADEFWLNSTTGFDSSSWPAWYIAMGQQNSNSPLVNWWGSGGSGTYWKGIADCNIFIERVFDVPDMDNYEKDMWAAEAKVLKAYYHFLLLRAYGPIVIRDVNVPVHADPSESYLSRSSVDECFDYIVKTIDEALPNLMITEDRGNLDVGRITQMVAKAIKAQVLVEAASPLFNGNTDMASLKNEDGSSMFNQSYDVDKWIVAAEACRDAIDFAHANGKQLQEWQEPGNVEINSPSTYFQMNLRTAFNESDNNVEALWFDTRSVAGSSFQGVFTPRGFDSPDNHTVSNFNLTSYMASTLNMAEKFYSKNGVPIEEDITYSYGSRYELTTVPNTDEYKYDLQANYTTVRFHLDREPRFYGTLSFDGGRYFMLSNKNDGNAFNTSYRSGGNVVPYNVTNYGATGYMVKKYVSPYNTYGANQAYNARAYVIPFIRLADLYLLYAETLNESQGPGSEVYDYVNRVRARSGLDGVVESWGTYSSQPDKPFTKEGMRDIIKRERTVELAFEGKRFWDLRRWKDAAQELNSSIWGWDISQKEPAAFYRPRLMFIRTFTQRDYFWPISIDELRRNPSLNQNVGW